MMDYIERNDLCVCYRHQPLDCGTEATKDRVERVRKPYLRELDTHYNESVARTELVRFLETASVVYSLLGFSDQPRACYISAWRSHVASISLRSRYQAWFPAL